jgi:replicative DNA helicase
MLGIVHNLNGPSSWRSTRETTRSVRTRRRHRGNTVEIIVRKQRSRPAGTAECRFQHEYTRFENLEV